jgi:flagellar basal-body rod protein FlgB
MVIREFFNNKLIGRTVDILSHSLGFRTANHNIISSNLANIDTPGYQPKSLTFSQSLRDEVLKTGVPMTRTDRKHLPTSPADGGIPYTVHIESPISGPNELNIDKAMTDMSENNLLYEASVRLLAKKFEALKTVITGGGR